MTMDQAERAYETQTVFRSFVDMVFHCLMNGDLSVYEVRDACTLGMNKYAEHNLTSPIFVTREQAEQFERGKMTTGKPTVINDLADSDGK